MGMFVKGASGSSVVSGQATRRFKTRSKPLTLTTNSSAG